MNIICTVLGLWCAAAAPAREAPTGWSLISGSSVGQGTLIGSIGDDYKTLEDCLKGWDNHKAETDRLNQGVLRSPEYVTTAYCIDRRTSRKVDIQTP